MNEYKIEAKNTGPGLSEVHFGNTKIIFDSSAERNMDWAGPAEILCSAFAACCLKNISRFSQILKLPYSHAEITVTAKREDKPPQIISIAYHLRIKTNESEQHLALLKKNMEQFGTIFNTLKSGCEIQGEIIKM